MTRLKLNIRAYLAIVLLGLAASGCVYYNTFFNARQAFDEAERYRKKTGQGTQSGYKTAIDKSLKVIEDHQNSKYYDDALFVLGVSYFYSQQYNKAERRLRELLADFPKSKFVPEGTVYLARAKLKIGATEDAIALFDEVFQGKFSKELRADAAMALGDYHIEQKDQPSALRYYMAVRDSLGDEEQRLEAQQYIADGYFDEYKFSDALKGYLQVLGLKPDHNQRYHALYQAAVCSYRLQRINVGLDYLKQLAKDPLYFDSLGAISLAVGEGHEEAGELEAAEGVYQDVAMTSKNNNWVGEAYYRLGLIYQFDYDDVNAAKKFYDKSAGSSGGTESGRDASARSIDIGKLQALTKAGLDTVAVRLAQEGLDSLSTSDSIDVILEMKLPPPPDTTKWTDSTRADSTLKSHDSLAVRDSLIPTPGSAIRDTLGLSRLDSLARQNGITKPGDSTPANRNPGDSAGHPQTPAGESAVARHLEREGVAPGAAAQVNKPPTTASRPVDSTGVRKSDSTSAQTHDSSLVAKSGIQGVPQTPQDSLSRRHADSLGLKIPDTTVAMAPSKPPVVADTSTHKPADSIAAKPRDTSASALSAVPKLNIPTQAATPADSTGHRDSTAQKPGPDSLAIAHPAVPSDSLAHRDTSRVTHPDSLAASTDTSKAVAKPVKDTSLTPAQIWKRINDAAESQYSLAQLYWFQLDKPDSAIKELTDLLQMFPKSERAPQAMVALSQMYRDYRADTVAADSILHLVLTTYPHSDDVTEALNALGLQGTPADTGYPEYYMRRAESFLFDKNDPDSARYYYRYVAREFPHSQFRDQAAFAAIWVVENYKNPGDSSVYYAYKRLSEALSGSRYAAEATKRLTYTPPPPIKIPSAKDNAPRSREDSLMAQGPNLVATPAARDTGSTYIDPLKAVYVGPKGEELVLLEIQPVQTDQEFVYPQEAYDLEGNQFLLYFQVLIDLTGRVIDEVLKIPTSSEELNKRAELTIRSMTFDPLAVQKELQRKATNLILPEEQTDPRGRWYVFKYTISKPDFITK